MMDKPLEKLFKSSSEKGIKIIRGQKHRNGKNVYLDIAIEEDTSRDVLKQVLSAVEKFGNALIELNLCEDGIDGAESHKTTISISSYYALQSDRLLESLDKAINENHFDDQYSNFIRVLDFYDLIHDKKSELICQMKILGYHMYEIKFKASGLKDTNECFTAFFNKLGLEAYDEHDNNYWIFKTGNKNEFQNMMDKICEVFASH